jgi:hypothetical protein
VTIKKKEKRSEILYAHITKTNKKWLKTNYKKFGYSTMSDFLNDLLDGNRTKKD